MDRPPQPSRLGTNVGAVNAATWATLAIAGLVFISAGLTAAWRRIEDEHTEFARVTAEDWEEE